jgi:hypothetical protein
LESWGVHNYDYGTLRLGVGSFCHSSAFKDYFLNEGDVWIGSECGYDGTGSQHQRIYTGYAALFFSVWGDYWYQNENSYTAYNYAHTAGAEDKDYKEFNRQGDPTLAGGFRYYPLSGSSIYW